MRESDRAGVIGQVAEKRLRQSEAAERLGLSVRQVKRLLARYRERGPSGLVSGRRGKPSNNAMAEAARREAMELVRERYRDFGPTFAREKLVEEHGHRLSVETLRQWMIADGLWRAKARPAMRVHQSRPRRECVGDLVQIDGSPHAWFEDRGPECVMIVYVDDATTRLLTTGFFAEETTEAYMKTTRAHLAAHGRPVAYYSDRHSVFRVNKKDREDELTQFSRALRTLDIAAIHARSPQAKGRVDRANQTLQDRLVKEMRLRGTSGMAAGNAYLPEFMADFNRRFAVAPRNPEDAHRAVLRDAAKAEQRARRPTSRRRTIPGGDRPMPAAGICGRVLADRRAPFGACGQPVDNAIGRVAVDQAFRRALPTGCPHSRASRPQPHSSATSFFFSKKRKARTTKGDISSLC